MASATIENVELRPGSHSSPDDGMCVVELASLLAGEAFSDHPRCVSRVAAAFLRGYNDEIDARRRQDLVPLAGELVGSACSTERELAQARRCRRWARPLYGNRLRWWLRPRLGYMPWEIEVVGLWVARRARKDSTDRIHQATLRFVFELLAADAGTPAAAGRIERSAGAFASVS